MCFCTRFSWSGSIYSFYSTQDPRASRRWFTDLLRSITVAPEHRADFFSDSVSCAKCVLLPNSYGSSAGQWLDGQGEIHDRFWSSSLAHFLHTDRARDIAKLTI